MKVFIFIAVFGSCAGSDPWVREGETVNFNGLSGAKKWFLLYGRENGGGYDEICTSDKGCNCSRFGNRISFTNDTFKLENARELDSGKFKVRSRFSKNNSSFDYYNLTVVRLRPVLVPVTLSQYSIGLMCVDRGNLGGVSEVYVWGMSVFRTQVTDPYKESAIKKWGENGVVLTQKIAYRNSVFKAACCSMKHEGGHRWCGPTAVIQLRGDICSGEVPGWQWCKGWKGSPSSYDLKGSWNTPSHLPQLYKPKEECKKHTASADTTACVEEQVKVSWNIGGIFGWHKSKGDEMHVRLDCGHSQSYWRFSGHVSCTVESQTRKGTSSTFLFNAKRTTRHCVYDIEHVMYDVEHGLS